MKKYPKLVQCDAGGQIVIPKEIRQDLGIEEGDGFWMYSISDEGILLKKINSPSLENDRVLSEIEEKSGKLNVAKKNLAKTKDRYRKTKKGKLELI